MISVSPEYVSFILPLVQQLLSLGLQCNKRGLTDKTIFYKVSQQPFSATPHLHELCQVLLVPWE